MKLTPTLLSALFLTSLHAADPEPAAANPAKMAWPEPAMVEPKYDGQPVPVPAGALVLFDGKETKAWKRWRFTGPSELVEVFPWKVEEGYIEVVHKAGRIQPSI